MSEEGKLIDAIAELDATVAELQSRLATATATIERLEKEIQARRQWQKCPQCNRTFATDF